MGTKSVAGSILLATAQVASTPAQFAARAESVQEDVTIDPQDIVSLSKLATDLRGKAGEVFSQLSKQDRATIANLVENNQISVNEVQNALTGLVKSESAAQHWVMATQAQQVDLKSMPASDRELYQKNLESLDALPTRLRVQRAEFTALTDRLLKIGPSTKPEDLAEKERLVSEIHKNAEQSSNGPIDVTILGGAAGTIPVGLYMRSDEENAARKKLASLLTFSQDSEEKMGQIASQNVAESISLLQAKLGSR